jgi:alkylation response protein AidB-like acyl-CoA dehydrogenase
MSVILTSTNAAPPPRHHAFELAKQIAREFAESAVERDQRGGTPKAQRDLLRQSGLLNLIIPARLGGWEMVWSDVMKIVRLFSRVDSSVAHLFAFQHLLLASVLLYGSSAQAECLFRDTVRKKWFWGNALNPLDRTTSLTLDGNGYRINGRKGFCSGACDSDMLFVSAIDSTNGKFRVAAIPSGRPGLVINQDWDNFGQRQTDSGSVEFHDVAVAADELLVTPGPLGSIRASLRSCIAQLILCNIYLGLAEGALEEARNYTAAQTRPWLASNVDTATQDPYILANYGRFFVDLQAARALTDIAGESLVRAWESGEAITEAQRGKCALDVAAAKVITTRSGLEITNRMFEVMGARATAGVARIDRFWRNLRVHTLHDPVDYKIRELGNWALNQRLPEPSFYS